MGRPDPPGPPLPRTPTPDPEPIPPVQRDPSATAEGLDTAYYPNLIDLIFEHADHGALLALRGACRAWYERADRLIVGHVISTGFRTRALAWISPGGRIPRKNWMNTELLRHVKRVDIHKSPEHGIWPLQELDILCSSLRRYQFQYSLALAKWDVRICPPDFCHNHRRYRGQKSHLVFVTRPGTHPWDPGHIGHHRLLSLTTVLWHIPDQPTNTGSDVESDNDSDCSVDLAGIAKAVSYADESRSRPVSQVHRKPYPRHCYHAASKKRV